MSEQAPYIHSDYATCVRDSEGTYSERRERLRRALERSSQVTKMELMQRNIMQGVNVVRRGMHMIGGQLRQRPSLAELIAAKKLPEDYLARAFPENLADSVAPLPERIERVSLQKLLAPPNGPAPSSRHPGPLDPAMLAAMMVQATMLGPRPLHPAISSTHPAQQLCGAPMLVPGTPAAVPLNGSAVMPAVSAAAGMPLPVTVPVMPTGPVPMQLTRGGVLAPPQHVRAPKPTLQAARAATGSAAGFRQNKPPFVLLVEDFCSRVLDGDASGRGAEGASCARRPK